MHKLRNFAMYFCQIVYTSQISLVAHIPAEISVVNQTLAWGLGTKQSPCFHRIHILAEEGGRKRLKTNKHNIICSIAVSTGKNKVS